MSHVEFKELPMSCHLYFPPCRQASCRMSILRNDNVALSNLRVKGPIRIWAESEGCLTCLPWSYQPRYQPRQEADGRGEGRVRL